ncbi:FAD-dependent oxidoreductase [Kitasatospora sp. NPDC052896]|uniref:FAD-dependent oxidoreductase n=1 Tax=Kitasatospora sp. NPDC052896 TaxID=3364061 RepID=UPI0037CBC23E
MSTVPSPWPQEWPAQAVPTTYPTPYVPVGYPVYPQPPAPAGPAPGLLVPVSPPGYPVPAPMPQPVFPASPLPTADEPEPIPAESFSPARPQLVPEAGPVKVSVDNNRCHIYGICQQEAPEIFRIAESGSLHYTANVPAHSAAKARQAARCCPMQAVSVRTAAPPAPARRSGRSGTATRPSLRRIVVAGGGLAGLSAATRLRERGFDGELVVVGEESRLAYSRPPLSKQYLAGELTAEELEFRVDGPIDAHWLLDTRMVGLDAAARTIELRGGEQLPYDGLVIATGVDARRLPEAPVFSERVRTVRTLEDAAAIRRALHTARAHHVVILGGGFVGCELACTARDHGMDVTLVVHSAPLLRRVLGRRLGEVVGRIQARAGVDVRLSTRITEWVDTGDGLRLRLDDGEVVNADFVVLGLGSVPRTEWLRGSGLDAADGVLCDATCHVLDLGGRPVPGVVAAGDVARWPNARFDATPRRIEHLIHAVEMGQHAADSLLRGPGRAARFTPVPRFWSEQHGRRLQAVGIPALGERVEIVEGSLRSESFVATYTRDTPQGPQLVAAVAFDMPRQLLAYRDLIGRTDRPRAALPSPLAPHPVPRQGRAGNRRRRR